MRMKESQWDEVFDVNIKGIFNCTKSVIRSMVKNQYGKIISISSVVGEMGNPGQANYSSTKSAIYAQPTIEEEGFNLDEHENEDADDDDADV